MRLNELPAWEKPREKLMREGCEKLSTAEILAKYPSYAGSYLYPYELFLGAAIAAVFIFLPARAVRRDARRLRAEKLEEIGK